MSAATRVGVEFLSHFTTALARAESFTEIFAVIEREFLDRFNLAVALIAGPLGDNLGGDPADSKMRLWMSSFEFDAEDARAAASALRHIPGTAAGTFYAENAQSCFLALHGRNRTIGALGLKPAGAPARATFIPAELEALAGQVAMALARVEFRCETSAAGLARQAEQLRKALLSSILHSVRSPLASILGSLSTIQEDAATLTECARAELIENARTEALRLNRLIGNLLDMSRLEAGAMPVRMELCEIQDAIGAAIEQLGPAAAQRQVGVKIPPGLPFIRMDFVLIVQVIVNLLDNALRYSPQNTPVEVEARVHGSMLRVCVLDSGCGIPEAELTNVFEKFNRAGRQGDSGGIGLGLSICKGLIEAHHGGIRAERREPRGTAVTFTIPLDGGTYRH